MVLIMLFNFVVMFVDVYVAGLISPAVQAAVGFVSQIYFLVIILANAISIGTVAIVSRAIGANDFPDALSVAKQSLVFGASVAAALTIIVALFCRDIVEFAGFPAETQEIAADFLRIFRICPWTQLSAVDCQCGLPRQRRAAEAAADDVSGSSYQCGGCLVSCVSGGVRLSGHCDRKCDCLVRRIIDHISAVSSFPMAAALQRAIRVRVCIGPSGVFDQLAFGGAPDCMERRGRSFSITCLGALAARASPRWLL